MRVLAIWEDRGHWRASQDRHAWRSQKAGFVQGLSSKASPSFRGWASHRHALTPSKVDWPRLQFFLEAWHLARQGFHACIGLQRAHSTTPLLANQVEVSPNGPSGGGTPHLPMKKARVCPMHVPTYTSRHPSVMPNMAPAAIARMAPGNITMIATTSTTCTQQRQPQNASTLLQGTRAQDGGCRLQ